MTVTVTADCDCRCPYNSEALGDVWISPLFSIHKSLKGGCWAGRVALHQQSVSQNPISGSLTHTHSTLTQSSIHLFILKLVLSRCFFNNRSQFLKRFILPSPIILGCKRCCSMVGFCFFFFNLISTLDFICLK